MVVKVFYVKYCPLAFLVLVAGEDRLYEIRGICGGTGRKLEYMDARVSPSVALMLSSTMIAGLMLCLFSFDGHLALN